jgi:hypothetical protein
MYGLYVLSGLFVLSSLVYVSEIYFVSYLIEVSIFSSKYSYSLLNSSVFEGSYLVLDSYFKGKSLETSSDL